MKKHNLAQKGKRALSMLLAAMMVLSCWVWVEPNQLIAEAANETVQDKDHFLFAYFTGTSKEGQTIHLAVSEDGYNYTALRGNDPVIIPSKGVGCVRDPYIWYNEQDNHYYILATDLDFTDTGSNYSNNSTGFIVWRSKDLVNWYDETFIDVSKMAHLIGDVRGMTAVWAPQVLWDGSAYVVYFTLACGATSWFDIVYLKTTDLLDPNAYYEFDYILGNGTGNGTDNGYGVIDADIIHNPGDGKYYLFYKVENHDKNLGTDSNNSNEALRKIFYYVGDTPTGPFENPGDTLWTNAGYSLWPEAGYSLEGCNAVWDNDGNLLVYADEFAHKNALGEDEAYFRIAKSNGYDFTSWSYPDVSQHNINSLSPRHGSVVKITEEEYNRLLANSYQISSSSFPATETLEDHLVGRFFTTENVLENTVVGMPDLESSANVKMETMGTSYVANFQAGYAQIDLKKLFLNGLNYDDGFTITFKAQLPADSTEATYNERIYEIADVFGKRTGVEHYTHFSASGGGTGTYMGTYNGPDVAKRVTAGATFPDGTAYTLDSNDWSNDINGTRRRDGVWHEYLISYANGNYIVYVDGVVAIMENRHTTAVTLDDAWYKAIGQATMLIGKSGWSADANMTGYLRDLCIYDTSMSYYDLQDMDSYMKGNLPYTSGVTYNGITSKVPTFTDAQEADMEEFRGTYFSNVLYSSNVSGTSGGTSDQTGYAALSNMSDLDVGVYYPEKTVLIYDGINDAIMPVMASGQVVTKQKDRYIYSIYPTTGIGSTSDNTEISLVNYWYGNENNDQTDTCDFDHAIENSNGNGTGYSSTNLKSTTRLHRQGFLGSGNGEQYWMSNALKVNSNIDFGEQYYKNFNLAWKWYAGSSSTVTTGDPCQGAMISGNDIYVINFKPIIELRSSITETEYNKIMNGNYCQALKEKYADAVFAIKTLNPQSYNYAANAEVGTKACAKAIKDAVDNYNGVKAVVEAQDASGVYGHEVATIEAREATCEAYGLTSGSYCTVCGEVIEEQKLIATLPHTFGAVFTENGIQYRTCSVCGITIEYQPSEVRYDNLFSLNNWYSSSSNSLVQGSSSGTITTNLIDGTIKFVNSAGTYNFTNVSFAATKDYDMYCIPVFGGRTYVAEFTYTCDQPVRLYVLVFDKDGNNLNATDDLVLDYIEVAAGSGTVKKEIVVPEDAAYLEIGFYSDYNCTATFSQIGVYEKETFDKFGEDTVDARLGFYPGDDKKLCYPDSAVGYIFDGWYTSNGVEIENVNQINNPSTIVYGKWITSGYDVSFDNIFSFSEWASSSCNQLETKMIDGVRQVSDKDIIADAENGTLTITNDADTTTYARTNYWVDNGNIYKMPISPNTEYIIEFTASSDDGAKPNICAYIIGGTANYPESSSDSYALGKRYFSINSGDNKFLVLRFDNVINGTTLTYSDIAVYPKETAEATSKQADASMIQAIENRQYRCYYPQKMGIGDIFAQYTPVRTGFTFESWMRDTDGDNIGDENLNGYDDSYIVDENWHLFSMWHENTYTIWFSGNQGSGSVGYDGGKTLKYTEKFTLPSGSGYTREGYYFTGWSLDENATEPEYAVGDTVSKLAGHNVDYDSITLYAVWKKIPNEISYENLFQFSKWAATASVTRYTTNGSMSMDAEAGTLTFTIDSGTDYYTRHEFKDGNYYTVPVTAGEKYTLEYTVEGGTNCQAFVYFSDGTQYINLPNSTNYYKGNWQAPTNTTGKLEVEIPTGATQVTFRFGVHTPGDTVTFSNIAFYRSNRSTEVDFDSWDSRYYRDIDLSDGLAQPSRVGYTFNGWFVDSDKDGSLDTEELKDHATNIGTLEHDSYVVLSDWSLNKYTIKFDGNGATDGSTADMAMTYDTSANLSANAFSKTGYTFTGWNTAANGSGTSYADKASVKNLTAEANGIVTLYAQWKANSYTIAFNGNGSTGGSTASQSMTYDKEANLNANGFTRKGYEFAGWNTVANGSGTGYTDKQSVKNLAASGTATLYAQWTANSYKVNFDGNGADGGSMTAQSITYDVSTPLVTNGFTKTGYTFKGWSETKGGAVKYTNGESVTNLAETGTVTLYAVWEANSYTIKFNGNGSTSGSTADKAMTYDKADNLTANGFSKTGYTFAGWSTSSTGSKAYSDKESVKNLTAEANGTVTLYAIWTENTYSIEFNANGGSGTTAAKSNVKYSATVTLTENGFSREGYDFLGWSTSSTGTKTYDDKASVSKLSETAGATVTLYAVWQINNSALVEDNVAIDFVHPTLIKPLENDTIFNEEAKNGSYSFNGLSTTENGTYSKNDIAGKYGNFTISDKTITYTPAGVIDGAEDIVYYSVSVTVNGKTTTLTSTITVAPASNVYYEESILTDKNVSGTVEWTSASNSLEVVADTSAADVYGYNDAYNNIKTFSGGSYIRADVTPDNVMSDTMTFDFVGSGFDLISACGKNTGVQIVKVSVPKDNGSGYKAIKTFIADTYFADTSIMTDEDGNDETTDDLLLRQVPIASFRRDWGTYRVEVTAAYLESSGAVIADTAKITYSSATLDNGIAVDTAVSRPSAALLEELEALGFEDLGDDIEVIWMDENSILNGGTGATAATAIPENGILSGFANTYFNDSAKSVVNGLTNYIDGIRIYNPMNGGVGYYKDSEQNPTYFNIVQQLKMDPSKSNAAYIESGILDFGPVTDENGAPVLDENGNQITIDFDAYNKQKGPKDEIYLKQGQGIAFTFTAEQAASKDKANIMLGLRAVFGNAKVNATVKTAGAGDITYIGDITSATEMYYKIAENVSVGDGVTIVVTNTGAGVLAVNNLKLVDGVITVKDNVDQNLSDTVENGNVSAVPTPVAPEAAQGNAGNAEDIPEAGVEESVDNAENNISAAIPGLPAPIASFLEMLFKLLGQLVGSLGF